MNKKFIVGAAVIALLSGSGGVYAGTLIKQGKTPRGNQYYVEKESIEKNKYQISVNGKVISGPIISTGNTVYVPLKNLPKSKFAIKYNNKNWAYDVKTIEQFELSRDIKNINKTHATVTANYKQAYEFFSKLYTDLVTKNGQFNLNDANNANDKVIQSIAKVSEQENEIEIIYSRLHPNKLEYSLFLKRSKNYFREYKYTNAYMEEIISSFQNISSKYSKDDLIPSEELERLNRGISGFKYQYESIPRKVSRGPE